MIASLSWGRQASRILDRMMVVRGLRDGYALPSLALITRVETSDSEDYFSDAKSAPVSPARSSPIPGTRIEETDDGPSRGDVSESEARRQRGRDAEPDEIAIDPVLTFPGPHQASPASELSPSNSYTARQTVDSQSTGATGPHAATFNGRVEEAHKADVTPNVVLQAADTTNDAGRSDP